MHMDICKCKTHAHGYMQVHKSSHSHVQLHIRRHAQTYSHTLIPFDRRFEREIDVLSRLRWTNHGDPTRKAPSDGNKFKRVCETLLDSLCRD